jgi:hypothetical protein
MKKKPSIPKLLKKAQLVFNAYIRRRDQSLPCISCGQMKTLQAGHYYAISTHGGLRFDEDNVHGECAGCNCFNESHLIGYGENLERRIGRERYFNLRQRAADYKRLGHKWSRAELLKIIEKYS